MSDYKLFNVTDRDLKHPELKGMVDHFTNLIQFDVLQMLQMKMQNKALKFEKLKVGGKKVMEYASVSEVISKYLDKEPLEKIQQLARYKGPGSIKVNPLFRFEGIQALDINSKVPIMKQIDVKSSFSYINDRFIFDKIGGIYGLNSNTGSTTSAPSTPPAPSPAPPPSSPVYSLKLNLKRVKCLDETDPEWAGKDSISAGGVTVDDRQAQSMISEFHVGKFNDGNVVNFNPVKVLKTFPLDNINPSTFMAMITLAEKDAGGFSSFLNELYQAIQANVQVILTQLGAAAGAAIGTAIGGAIGTAIAGPLGTIIGIAAGLILGAIIGWLVNTLKDDIFPPAITGIQIDRNAPFVGPVQTLTYRDFGGSYIADVFWSVS